jgi:hypothetical protein
MVPEFDEPVVGHYGKEELQKFFALQDGEERIRYQMFLCSELREREVMNSQALSAMKSNSNSAIQAGS